MCYRWAVIGDGIFIMRRFGFVVTRMFPLRMYWMALDHVCSCDLDLDLITFISSDRQTDRHTDRQTESIEIINHAALRVVKNYR